MVGELIESAGAWGIDADSPKDLPVPVSYNPFKGGHFVDDEGDAMALIEEAYGSAEIAALRQASVRAGLTTGERFDEVLLAEEAG